MTAPDTLSDWVYAGFWIRVWASLLDAVMMTLMLVPLGLAIAPLSPEIQPNQSFNASGILLGVIIPALVTVFFWVYKSATPGKMMIKARIVDARTGERPSPRQSIIRFFANYLSLIPMGLGYLWIAWDPRKRGWHDLLAGTVVIRQGSAGAEPIHFEQSTKPPL